MGQLKLAHLRQLSHLRQLMQQLGNGPQFNCNICFSSHAAHLRQLIHLYQFVLDASRSAVGELSVVNNSPGASTDKRLSVHRSSPAQRQSGTS